MSVPTTFEEKLSFLKQSIRDYSIVEFAYQPDMVCYSVIPYKIKKSNDKTYTFVGYYPITDKLYSFIIDDIVFFTPEDAHLYQPDEPETCDCCSDGATEISPWKLPNETCQGCIEDQPNQLAHMGPGGCLE